MADTDILNVADDDLILDTLPSDNIINQPSDQQPEVAVEETSTETQESEEVDSDKEELSDTDTLDTEIEDTQNEAEEEPSTEDKDISEETEEPSEQAEPETSIDYKAVYEKIFSPFKANGKQMKIDNPEDVINLMRMGANYNLKMNALKPNLKIVKMLQNNDLLDENKINYLIDLDKKNPEAVKKLIKDSNLDPFEVDSSDENADYTPNAYTVSDTEVELDQVLDELKSTPVYDTMIETVGKKWDEPSRQIILQQPKLLYHINEHMDSGVFDIVNTEMEKNRILGKLQGMSDIEAYNATGQQLTAEGKLQLDSSTKDETPIVNKPKKADPKLAARKKAASSTNTAPSREKDLANFNPLNMSDEEFDKLTAKLHF
jgi:hypothetical protein